MGIDNNTKDEGEINMAMILDRPCTPVQSLEQSLKEMQMIREGKLPKNNWRDLFKELREDNNFED